MPLLDIQSVSKRYPFPALQDVSLTIEQGDIYGIIGLSGAGKSTLIRSLAHLVTPTTGRILFNGQDMASMDKAARRQFHKNIGMIFQHFNLLESRTVAGNIAYPMEITHVILEAQQGRVDELLDLVNLKNKRDLYPSKLSGGEKQRVGIARALANSPLLLLCDEATSALDPKTTREILDLLKSVNRALGVTIVLITHEMEVIKQICNKVAVLEGGRVVENGLVEDVFADPHHPTTKHFLHSTSYEIPPEFFQEISPNRKLVRLRFKGQVAGQPIVSELVRRCSVDANILLGRIDRCQSTTIGTLIIELRGAPESIESALEYLKEKQVHTEVMENES